MVAHDNQKGKFYPIFDFTTEFNSKRQIIRYLNFAKLNLNLHFSKNNEEHLLRQWKHSPFIVTFYSLEAINSLLFSFNTCECDTYLNWTFNILSNNGKYVNNCDYLNQINSYVYICANNFLSYFIFKIRKLKIANKSENQILKIKLLITYCLALLQNCSNLTR